MASSKSAKNLIKQARYRGPNGVEYTPEQMEQRKLIFFEPVQTKDDLRLFLKVFFNIELPDNKVDEHSTSTPLQFVWDVYSAMLTNDGPKDYVVAAARNAGKTLCAAITHFLAMVHFRRSCLHIASIKSQARVCMKYMDSFCRLPEVAPYFVADNTEERRLENLPVNWFTTKTDAEVSIVAASIRGANSKRASYMCQDEVDLTPREVLSEVAGVLDPTLDDHKFSPIVVSLSSRKTNDGPLQDKIDEAEKEKASGKSESIRLVRFSMVDWMEKCTTAGPSTGQAWVHTSTLQTIWSQEDYDHVPETEKGRFYTYNVGQNCKSCPAFLACLGRSVNQKTTSSRLRNKEFVGTVLKAVKDSNVIAAQYLNWKPETTGVVFRSFDVYQHCKTLNQMWTWLGNTPWENPQPLTLHFLASWLRSKGWAFHWGVDWGYTDPASCVVMAYNPAQERAVILKCLTKTGYANQQWADYVCGYIPAHLTPEIICPDAEDPASSSYFKRHGLRCRREKPKKISTGVSQMRGLLWDPTTQSTRMAVLVDPMDPDLQDMQVLVHQMMHWKHRRTPLGDWDMNTYEDGNDHTIDPQRYILDMYLKTKGKVQVGIDQQEVLRQQANEIGQSGLKDEMRKVFTENGSPYAFDQSAAMEVLKDPRFAHLIQDTMPGTEPQKRTSKVKFHL